MQSEDTQITQEQKSVEEASKVKKTKKKKKKKQKKATDAEDAVATQKKKKKTKKKKKQKKTSTSTSTAQVSESPSTSTSPKTPSPAAPSPAAPSPAAPSPAATPVTTVTATPAPAVSQEKKNKIPNARPKQSAREQAKMEAMMGKLSDEKRHNICIIEETDKTEVFVKESTSGAINLKEVPIVYIKNCTGGNYTFNRRITKMFVENCTNCKITINENILTNTVEAWKGGGLTLNLNTTCFTVQLDMLDGVDVTYQTQDNLGSLVWNQLDNANIKFGDKKEDNIKTGMKEVKAQWADSNVVDQFIVRVVDGVCKLERCIRLKNGHLSTEREAVDWDKRNSKAKEVYMNKFMKEAGIHLNPSMKKKILPNSKCPCGSGKKYKKCCMNLKSAAGTEGVKYKA